MFKLLKMNRLILILSTLVLLGYNSFAATKTASDGNWNSAVTWSPAGAPSAGDDVVIPSGVTVKVNCNCGAYNSMRIYVSGTLDFNNGKKINLTANGELHIFLGGRLTGGNGGSKFNIGNNTIWRGNQPDLTGPSLCLQGGCGGSPTGLPVSLIDFVAELTEEKARIEWTTASEVNNDYFVIQRMQESGWESIGEVHGFGTTNKVHYYQYDDYEIDMSLAAFYRLKQVDIDGGIDYSKVIDIEPIELKGHKYSFMNIGNNIRIGFEDDHLEQTTIYVINTSGQHVNSYEFEEIHNGQELSIDLGDLSKGWYVIGIVGKDNAHFEKMLFVE